MRFTRREILLAMGAALGGVAFGRQALGGHEADSYAPTKADSCAPAGGVGLVHGVFAGNDQWGDTSHLDNYVNLAGAQPHIVSVFQAWRWNDHPVYFVNRGFNHLYEKYPLTIVTWEPRSHGQVPSGEVRLDEIVAGSHNDYIAAMAREMRDFGKRVLLRFGHEMNLYRYSWGQKSSNYIHAWRRVHEIFRVEGANNVEWVWCPNVRGPVNPDLPALREFYPGDEYVDWLGLDGYNWAAARNDPWFSFSEVFSESLAELRDTVNSEKEVIICEYGCHDTPGDKGSWFAAIPSAFNQPQFANVAALIYFHRNRDGANWRVDYPQSALDAYRELIGAGFYLGTPL
jgi:mannan endo-1,4-beta-mannosidase